MKTKFTKGEWTAITPTEVAVTGDNWACITTVNRLRPKSGSPTDKAEKAEYSDPDFHEECANAKLIADAPKMFQLLEEIYEERYTKAAHHESVLMLRAVSILNNHSSK